MEIWFSESTANIIFPIIGGGLSILFGLYGTFGGIFAPKGKFKRLILSAAIAFIAIGAIMLITGLFALISKQPYHVWYPFILTGGIILPILVPNYFILKKRFSKIEVGKAEPESR